MATNMTKPTTVKQITRTWHIIDAKDRVIGRLSTEIAQLLMGKSKPYFVRNLDCGDHVVVINAKSVKVGGKKTREKVYYRHSGYPGGFRGETFEELQNRKPEDIILHGVKGMLPQNKLRDSMMKRLHVFAGEEHGFTDKFIIK